MSTLFQTTITDPVELEERELANDIIEAIERPQRGKVTDDQPGGFLPALKLPGYGTEYEDCGDEIPHFCTDCGHTFTVGRTCRRSTCPRCAPAWVVDKATTIVGKLDAAARMMSAELDGVSVKKHHVVLSPPDDWYLRARDPLEKTMEVVKEIFELMGAEGVPIFHSFRGNSDHEDDLGAWKKRQFSGRDWEGDVRDELRPSGHFHCFMVSPFIPGGEVTRMINEQTDWVIKRVTKAGSSHSLTDLEDVARAVSYSLSHVGIKHTENSQKNNQAVYRYVGSRINGDIVRDEQRRQASRAVRKVAPKTLGISANQVRCGREIGDSASPGMAGIEESELWEFDEDAAPDDCADCAPADDEIGVEADEDAPDLGPSLQCAGKIEVIEQAPDYLDDPEWVARAAAADELQTTWEDWIREGGWKG